MLCPGIVQVEVRPLALKTRAFRTKRWQVSSPFSIAGIEESFTIYEDPVIVVDRYSMIQGSHTNGATESWGQMWNPHQAGM